MDSSSKNSCFSSSEKILVTRTDKRSKNFQKTEIDLLLELVTKYKDILECKVTDRISQKDKDSAWLELSNKFNQESVFVYRDSKTLKSKYENIKKTSKKKWAEEKRYVLGTGGGPSQTVPITDTDFKVKQLLGVTQVDGLPSIFDSDYECQTRASLEIATRPTSPQPCASFNIEDVPVILEEEEEEEVTKELVPGSETKKRKVDGDLLVPVSAETEFNGGFAKATDFSIKMLKNKTSSPLQLNKKKKPIFDKTRASKQIEDLSAAKIELIFLQRKTVEEQLKIQQQQQEQQYAEHQMKMKCIEEEHKMKMKLLQLQIKKAELDLNLKDNE